jgi:hypothetical protein
MASFRCYTPYLLGPEARCLRLEAQQAALRAFISDLGQLQVEFIEIESNPTTGPTAAILAA